MFIRIFIRVRLLGCELHLIQLFLATKEPETLEQDTKFQNGTEGQSVSQRPWFESCLRASGTANFFHHVPSAELQNLQEFLFNYDIQMLPVILKIDHCDHNANKLSLNSLQLRDGRIDGSLRKFLRLDRTGGEPRTLLVFICFLPKAAP